MKPRVLLVLAGLVLLGAIGIWLWPEQVETSSPIEDTSARRRSPVIAQRRPESTGQTPAVPAQAPLSEAPVRVASSVVPGTPMASAGSTPSRRTSNTAPAASTQPYARPVTHPEAREDLENLRLMFRDFRTRLGGNPVGSNAEIMKAVMGENSARARLGPPEGQGLNNQGELVDRWGTAYFFHQLSKTEMEIRSAGPDQILWTSDDLVQR